MKSLEAILLILAGMIGIQVLCGRFRLPGAIFPGYVVYGLLLGAGMSDDTRVFLRDAGQFGFILLLYLLGLEVRIPRMGESLLAMKAAARWFLWQVPLVMLVGTAMGLSPGATALAALALSGVAVGMAHPLLHEYSERGGARSAELLSWLVALEVWAILLLSGGDALFRFGLGWDAALKIFLMVFMIGLLAHGAPVVGGAIRRILDRALRWRIHGVLLLLFGLCAVSDRIGLAAPKAAFFLGLFTHTLADEKGQDTIEESLRPLARDFLIPIFFVYLGTLVSVKALFSPAMLWAALTTLLLVCWRMELFRRKFMPMFGWRFDAVRTTLPNLSMVAVGVQALRQSRAPEEVTDWLLLSGLMLSLLPMFWRAGAPSGEPASESSEGECEGRPESAS